MSTSLRLHPSAPGNQNLVLEKLHHEAIAVQSVRAAYIPRVLIAEDKILGEDRLSQYNDAYPIDIYIENVDGFNGQNAFASKFGLQIESNATFTISRRGWDQLVGQHEKTILPNRPAEGDLIYLPMTRGLFEINFCEHQNPFYQLGQYYTYKLQVELFRYSSEAISTGFEEIDSFTDVHTHDISIRPNIDTLVRGAENQEFGERAATVVVPRTNVFGDII